MNVAEAILAAGRDDAPAVLYGREVLTYGELRARVGGLAAHLLEGGAVPGERVGLFAENSPLFITAYLAAMGAGLCVVPFRVECRDKTLAHIAAATGMRRILVSPRFRPRVVSLAEKLGLRLEVEGPGSWPRRKGLPALPATDPRRALAAIMFTSGSTGEAKGVMVSHRNIECNARDIIGYMRLGAADRAMVVLPLTYCYGASLLHTLLMAGGSLVLNNRFMFPEKVLDDLEAKQCTGFAGVPSSYQILLRRSRFARRRFPALRWLQQAGGRLPPRFIREIRQAMPDVRFFVMYGQTEATSRLSYLEPERLEDKLGAVGRIGRSLPGTRLEVLRPDGTPVRAGSEEVGEIVAAGENVTLGYWNDPEETARYFHDGKLHTGDLARVDRDGYVFLGDRARDFIKPMGNRVSPAEVEDVLAELPGVVEVAVVGAPDDFWGEAVHAFLVPAEPGLLTADQVRAHCLRQLPNYKIPQFIEFLPQLPKNSHGKVAKEELRRRLATVK